MFKTTLSNLINQSLLEGDYQLCILFLRTLLAKLQQFKMPIAVEYSLEDADNFETLCKKRKKAIQHCQVVLKETIGLFTKRCQQNLLDDVRNDLLLKQKKSVIIQDIPILLLIQLIKYCQNHESKYEYWKYLYNEIFYSYSLKKSLTQSLSSRLTNLFQLQLSRYVTQILFSQQYREKIKKYRHNINGLIPIDTIRSIVCSGRSLTLLTRMKKNSIFPTSHVKKLIEDAEIFGRLLGFYDHLLGNKHPRFNQSKNIFNPLLVKECLLPQLIAIYKIWVCYLINNMNCDHLFQNTQCVDLTLTLCHIVLPEQKNNIHKIRKKANFNDHNSIKNQILPLVNSVIGNAKNSNQLVVKENKNVGNVSFSV